MIPTTHDPAQSDTGSLRVFGSREQHPRAARCESRTQSRSRLPIFNGAQSSVAQSRLPIFFGPRTRAQSFSGPRTQSRSRLPIFAGAQSFSGPRTQSRRRLPVFSGALLVSALALLFVVSAPRAHAQGAPDPAPAPAPSPGLTVTPGAGCSVEEDEDENTREISCSTSETSGQVGGVGVTAVFTVQLATEPVGPVIVSITSSNTEYGGTVSPDRLVFIPTVDDPDDPAIQHQNYPGGENWNAPQTVTITSVSALDESDSPVIEPDAQITPLPDGTRVTAYTITLSSSGSPDSVYANLVQQVVISARDHDGQSPTVTVGSPQSEIAAAGADADTNGHTTEFGGTDSFTVVLSNRPAANVVIAVSSDDDGEGTPEPEELTFTTANWNTPQTVTVTGVNDDTDDGDQVYNIVLAAVTSMDVSYQGVDPDDVAFTNVDNDPLVGFDSDFQIGLEGEMVTVDLSFSAGLPGDVTIPVRVTPQGGGSRADFSGCNRDYSGRWILVSATAGATSASFTCSIVNEPSGNERGNDDDESLLLEFDTSHDEWPEALTVTRASGPDSYHRATVQLLDTPLVVGFVDQGDNVEIDEDGNRVLSVTLFLDRVSQGQPADPATMDNPNTAGILSIPLDVDPLGDTSSGDYFFVLPNGTQVAGGAPLRVPFYPTQPYATFRVVAVNDNEPDSGEGLRISFGTQPTGVVVCDDSGLPGGEACGAGRRNSRDVSLEAMFQVAIADNNNTPVWLSFTDGSGNIYTARESGNGRRIEVEIPISVTSPDTGEPLLPGRRMQVPMLVTSLSRGGEPTARDYDTSGSAFFEAGRTQGNFLVTVYDDEESEGVEVLEVRINAAAIDARCNGGVSDLCNVAADSQASVTVEIHDDGADSPVLENSVRVTLVHFSRAVASDMVGIIGERFEVSEPPVTQLVFAGRVLAGRVPAGRELPLSAAARAPHQSAPGGAVAGAGAFGRAGAALFGTLFGGAAGSGTFRGMQGIEGLASSAVQTGSAEGAPQRESVRRVTRPTARRLLDGASFSYVLASNHEGAADDEAADDMDDAMDDDEAAMMDDEMADGDMDEAGEDDEMADGDMDEAGEDGEMDEAGDMDEDAGESADAEATDGGFFSGLQRVASVTTFWGNVSARGFAGDIDHVDVDGEVVSAYLGVDRRVRENLVVGLAVGRSEGDVDSDVAAGRYAPDQPALSTEWDLDLSTIAPYINWMPREGTSVFGIAGYGSGAMEGQVFGRAEKTDIDMHLLAFGASRELRPSGPVDLRLAADALLLDTSAKSGLAASLGEVKASASRYRLLIEGASDFEPGLGGRFSTALSFGGRYDEGDGGEGYGAELGARFVYSNTRTGVQVKGRGHVLLAHSESDFKEWGVGLEASYDPALAGQGFRLSLRPAWGAQTGHGHAFDAATALPLTGGAFSDGGPGALGGRSRSAAAGSAAQGRVDAQLAYNIVLSGGRAILTPFAELGLAEATQRRRLGSRLQLRPGAFAGLPTGLGFEFFAEQRSRGRALAGESRLGLELELDF